MSTALFIHRDQDFLERIQKEAVSDAVIAALEKPLVATSLLNGIKIISNPEIALSGIFFDPTDTSFSALRFIEMVLFQRPSTPLYVINEDTTSAEDIAYQTLLANNHIRESFKGTESYSELTKKLKLNPNEILNKLRRGSAPRGEHSGFIAIPVVDFIHEDKYPFHVFIENAQKELTLFATSQSEIDSDYLVKAADISNWLYVDEKEILEIKDKIRHTQLHLMDTKGFPTLWKSAEILFNTKTVLNEMRKNGVSDHLIEQTLYTLGDVFQMVSVMGLEEGNSNLNLFIEQAKECDKTIASATLSILMCKSLKFDRNAVLEILGLASLLQDVSLYNSPHGNISNTPYDELPPAAQAYFNQHPLISSDLVAQNANIPDVALQVIRQQHERKDKTGYPNRIGGMQLHPMAEVLSLINSFLDHSGPSPHLITLELYKKLEYEVFPHYSERTVGTFKAILTSFLA